MEQHITKYLIQKYNPVAVLIHGSRSNEYAREHSDWDFAILVPENVKGDREMIEGQNIEVRVLVLPFEENTIGERWLALRKGNVKVVYDPTDITGSIIEKVTEYYNKPIEWSLGEIFGHKAWYRSHLDGMNDYQYEQEAFFRKLGELYLRSIQYWFHFLHSTYMPQVYLSLPRIEKEDPGYYEFIKILASNATNQEKIKAGEEIYKRIWK